MKRRKGTVFDVPIGLTLIFIVAIAILVTSLSNNIVMSAYANNTQTNQSTVLVREKMTATFNTFNYGFLIAFVGMWITICILAYYSDYHPLFFMLSIVIMLLSVFYSFFLSNAYWSFVQSSSVLQALAEQFWIVTHIMKHLPFYTTGFSFLVGFVTYMGKRGSWQQ